MKSVLYLDFETRSMLDLKQVGLWNYARHPSTDVWCAAYALNDDEPYVIQRVDLKPNFLTEYVTGSGIVVAHNVPFELAIWNEIMVPRYKWPVLRPEQTYCTMAQCYAMGLPGGLEDAALAVGLHVLKDAEGRSLMLRMARPRRMEGDTPIWWDDPDKLNRLYEYCCQDVRVGRELHKRLAPLSAYERRVWQMDYAINQRGVAVDLPTAVAGARMADAVVERAGLELAAVTNGAVTTPNALIPLKAWVVEQGVAADSLDKESVATLLVGELPAHVRKALILRQEAGKASVAKLNRIQELAGSDARLHNWAQYHGAATGRWAARGVQVHNLVRDMPTPEIVEEILGHVRDGALEWLDMAYGPPMTMISRCLRSFFVAAPGKVLITGDSANVESRGTAWISGEQWKLNAFRDADAGTGPGVYELTAHRLLDVPLEQITKDSAERQVGKVAELAFGYQGGVGAAHKFLPVNLKGTPVATLNAWKLAWRAAHPAIQHTWKELEGSAIHAVRTPGEMIVAGFPGRHVTFKMAGSFLWCKLPSGRVLCYPYPKLLAGVYGDQLTYMTVPSANDTQRGQIIADPKNSNTWARVSTYGGSLMENVVQALCRDLLADVMLRLHDLNAPIVLHVHDEIVLEVPSGKASAVAAYMQEKMRSPPEWAAGFPLWADCHVMQRYGK